METNFFGEVKGKISKRELEYMLEKMEEHELEECHVRIGEWSDTKLVQLSPLDKNGDDLD